MGAIATEQPAGKEVESALGVVRSFHVQSNEAAELPGLVEDTNHVALAEVLAEVQTHLGELDRNIDLPPPGRQAIHHREVLVPCGNGLRFHVYALAEEVQRGRDAPPVQ